MTATRLLLMVLEIIGAVVLIGGGLGAIAACMLSSELSKEEEAAELQRWLDAHRIDDSDDKKGA